MNTDVKKAVSVFLQDEAGLELLEYTIAAVLIAACILAAFANLGSSSTPYDYDEVVASERS